MLKAEGIKGGYLEYKGRPLVRQDNDIYYGDLSDKYHVYMMIMTEVSSGIGNEDIPDKIMVQLLPNGKKMPEKQIVANGISDALETADASFDRRRNGRLYAAGAVGFCLKKIVTKRSRKTPLFIRRRTSKFF